MSVLMVPALDEEPWPTLGPQIADLLETYSIFGPGSLKGQPYKLDDEKRAALYRLYEVYPKGHPWAGRRRFKRGGISWRKGLAKALALDTPLPCPEGWVRMGDVELGQVLFDERGQQCRVVGTSEVFTDHDCYRVTFKDGSSIVADAGHRWYTEELQHRYAGSVKTTKDLAQSVVVRADGAHNHRIPVAGALDLPEADLPVDPWVLGAWLGDGRTSDAEFTMHREDYPGFAANVELAGYFMAAPKVDARSGAYDVRVSSSPIRYGKRGLGEHTLKGRLRELGVLGDKHVPTEYLRASYKQRLRVLQGLMDTDGTISPSGDASFTSTLRVLAENTYELMCSLGLKPTIRPTKTRGRPAWKVFVHANSETPIFSLGRKVERQRPRSSRTAMSTNRHIVLVEQVPTVPTRCLAVDSPSHLFLAGEAMVPTHNTEFLAQVTFAELHAEGPVRCDGFDASGNPVGRPVNDPYIPLLAVTVEQVEELGYGALYVLCTEGPDADLFDATQERIIRLGPSGQADGKCVPLSNSPGSRDGARTTFQGFDEPHRLFLPRALAAHETMVANLEKRVLEDPWGLYVGTAGEPGQGSIAEDLHTEAQQIERGEIADPQLFYFHREAGPGFDLSSQEERIAAVQQATGPIGEYGPGQFASIARQWERPGADKKYLERVWLNRWTRSDQQAFNPKRWDELGIEQQIAPGSLVTLGFDGARFRDATGLVMTDVETGRQRLWGLWERPLDAEEWEVDEVEVTESVATAMARFEVWGLYGDPPHWTETMGSWASKWPDKVTEWWTNRITPMAQAVRAYREAMDTGAVTWVKDTRAADLTRHIAAAGRKDVNLWDDDGRRLFILQKLHPDRKFDAAMAGCLSWRARLDALKAGAKKSAPTRRYAARRLY